jgi:Na+/proline symporter
MYNGQPIFIPIVLVVLGLFGLILREKNTDELVKNHEKYVLGGKKASGFVVVAARLSVVSGAVSIIAVGAYLLLSMLTSN